ncbi:ImpB/MucB/SamB family protein [Streptomyces sp. NBC_01335]|uniref:DNA polymerase Y family protein n=1 Tax=Streptomyces sp. NBC_01335 TaxID=2903828 RepID=UPI002E1484D1|nr:ImpB/MucB/SamB family protein [Streptomyces sp. NBC_01335]
MTPPRPAGRHIAHLHLHPVPDEERYADIVELMSGITPHVRAVPPDAVQLDLTSALRYFGLAPYDLVQMVMLRLFALYGIECGAGLAGNRMLAAMAADASGPGHTTEVPGDRADSWLRPRPVAALPGVGRATATALGRYGVHTIGQIADLPPLTLQRLLGAGPARLLAERAHGRDPRPVVPQEPAAHLSVDLVLDRDCLDPGLHHRAVLGLAERLGQGLRAGHRVAGRLTLTVRYADRTSSTRSRTSPEPTGHSPLLAATALGLLDSLGLQRARVRAYTLRADGLSPAEDAPRQLSLDPVDDRSRAAEAASDRARRRFGAGAVRPATLAPAPGTAPARAPAGTPTPRRHPPAA